MKITWHARLSFLSGQGIARKILAHPQTHLLAPPITVPGSLGPFTSWHPKTRTLQVVPINIRDWTYPQKPFYRTLLGAQEMTQDLVSPAEGNPAWIFSNGRVLELIEQKCATLPAEYIQDQDLYDLLSDFTYRFTTRWIDIPSRLSF